MAGKIIEATPDDSIRITPCYEPHKSVQLPACLFLAIDRLLQEVRNNQDDLVLFYRTEQRGYEASLGMNGPIGRGNTPWAALWRLAELLFGDQPKARTDP